MKKFLLFLFAALFAATSTWAQNSYFQGFEDPNWVPWQTGDPLPRDWQNYTGGNITRVASGYNGIASASGSVGHAVIEVLTPTGGSAPYTYGGQTSEFGFGFTRSLDVYIDPSWADNKGFDLSMAISNNLGGHKRDFMWHVGKVTGHGLLVNASSNSDWQFNSYKLLYENSGYYFTISNAGWYTLESVFYASNGLLYVDFNLRDADGLLLHTITRGGSPEDDIPGSVGGARYMWFAYNNVQGLAIDNTSRINYFPPVHNTTQGTYFETIQAAINAANPDGGDVIEVAAGLYEEDLVIAKPLTLKSTGGPAQTTIKGVMPGDNGNIQIKANNITIDGFTLKGNKKPIRLLTATQNFKFLNNKLVTGVNTASQNGWVGIESNYDLLHSGLEIDNNTFVANTTAQLIYINNTPNVKFTNNTLEGTMFPGGLPLGLGAFSGAQVITNNTFNIASSYALVEIESGTYDFFDILIGNTWPQGGVAVGNKVLNTIQAAIIAAAPGNVIAVAAGNYTGHFVISKNLTLKGAKFGVPALNRTGDETLIRGTFNLQTPATDLTIDGFSFVANSGANELGIGGPYHTAVYGTVNKISVKNNIFNPAANTNGPFSEGSLVKLTGTDLTVQQNVITQHILASDPLALSVTANGTALIGNNTTTAAIGVGTGASAAVSITNNTITNAWNEGIWFWPVDATAILTITGNKVTACNASTGGASALKVVSKPALINTKPISLDMYNQLLVDNPNVSTVLLQWMGPEGPVYNITKEKFYQSILDAISDAAENDVIEIAAGNLIVPGQISISKNLTIKGAANSKALTTLTPGSNTTFGGNVPAEAFIYIAPLTTVTLQDLNIDCAGYQIHHAVQSRGNLTVDNCVIKNVKYSTYQGRGIVLYSGPGLIKNTSFSNIERIGIHVRGNVTTPNPVATIQNVTYVGKGTGDWLDYAVEFGGGGQGTVDNLNASDCLGVASVDGSTSAGVLVTDYFGTGTTANISNSTFTNNTTGIFVGYNITDQSTVTASHNKFLGTGTTNGIKSKNPAIPVVAEGNYWGTLIGSEIAAKTSGNIDYTPWCNSNFTICTLENILTTIENPVATGCGNYNVDITVENFINVGAISLALNYDIAQLDYLSITPNTAISNLSLLENTPGHLRMSYYNNTGVTLAADAVLLTLNFNLLPSQSGIFTNLTWSTVPEDCQYAEPGLNGQVYGSTFTDLLNWEIPVRPVKNMNTLIEYCKIQDAIDATQTLNTHEIQVSSGTYDEQVLVNKELIIKGVGSPKPIINFTGTVSGKPTLFDVSVDNVTIQWLNFKVDLSKLRSAIIASGAGIDNIFIKNNYIEPYGTPAGSYGDRNAVSINYSGTTNYRVATGGVNNVVYTENEVTYEASGGFRAALALDEGNATITNNNATTINHDVLVRFSSGAVTVTGNDCRGGGMEFSDFNAGTEALTISGNYFISPGAPGTAVLRLKNNYYSRTTTVSGNTFIGHEWGVSLENYNTVTLDGNSFTPATGSTTFHHITFNTKSISSNSSTISQVTIGATLTKNTFNTFNGWVTPGGTALSFHNHDNDNASFGTFTIGTSGNENTFNEGIGTYVYLDNQIGSTNVSTFPVYPNTGSWPTNMAPWAVALNATNNLFAASPPKLPSTMTLAELFSLEDKIQHAIDDGALGFVTVKDLNTYVTVNSFVAPATTTPSIQRGVDAASNGWTVHVKAGTYAEQITINKQISLLGPYANLPGYDVGRLPLEEAVIQVPAGATNNTPLIYIPANVHNVTIAGLDLRCQDITIPNTYYLIGTWEQVPVNNLTIRNNRFYSSEIPIYMLAGFGANGGTGLLIEGNYIDCGPNVNNSYNRGMYIGGTSGTIQDNVVLNTNIGIQYMPYDNAAPGMIRRNTVSAGLIGLYNNYQTLGAAQVTWSQNEVTVAPNDRLGLKAQVDGAWTTEMLNFRGMEARTFGTQGTGSAPQAYFNNNKIDGNIGSSTWYTTTFGYRTFDDPAATEAGTATLSENSFTNFITNASNVPAGVTLTATCNWWGTADGDLIAPKMSGTVNYIPWLVDGTDYLLPTPLPGFQPVPGSCTGAPDFTGNYKYYNAAQTKMNNVTVELWKSGSKVYPVSGTVTTNGDGIFTFTNVLPDTYEVRASTVKPVGGINSTDAAQVNYWGVNTPLTIEKVRFYAGDVNNDLSVLSTDAGNIQAYFLTQGTTGFTRSAWSFWTAGETISINPGSVGYPSVTIPGIGSTVTKNFYGLVTGDFNRSFTPNNAKSGTEYLSLEYGNVVEVSTGSTFTLPVYAGMDMEVGALTIILGIPSGQLGIQHVYLGGNPDIPVQYEVSGDEVRLSWYSMVPLQLQKGEILLTIELAVTGSFSEEFVYVTLADDILNELADGTFTTIEKALLTVGVIKDAAFGIHSSPAAAQLRFVNQPNPFKGTTNFVYTLPADGHVVIEIHDIVGNRLGRITDEFQLAGEHTMTLDAGTLQPGVYTATLILNSSDNMLLRTIKIIKN